MINGCSLFYAGGSSCSCCDEQKYNLSSRATSLHLLTLGPVFRFLSSSPLPGLCMMCVVCSLSSFNSFLVSVSPSSP